MALRRLRTHLALLTVRVKRGPDGRKLRRLQVALPRGLSVRGKDVTLNKRVTAH